MGILDDAIREHLELKRQHGARDSEIKELEDQAFGPPSRPGEPDFPERPTGEAELGEENGGPVAEAAVAEPPPADVEPAEPDAPEAPSPALGSVEQHTQPFDAATAAGAPPEPVAEVVEETADEEGDGGGLFDQELDEDLGVEDLDLELDEESAEPAPVAEVEPVEPEPEAVAELEAAPGEPELEPMTELESAPAEPEPPMPPPTEEQLLPSGDLLDEEEGESDELELPLEPEGDGGDLLEEGEDVLEETPEFLRESPDDEELWFEQGAPQDFDFEDEED